MGAIDVLLLLCAFGMGFLVPRGTTCAVAAVGEVMMRRKAWRFGGFAMASVTGIVVLLPLSWAEALPLHFAPTMQLSLLIALGGFVFGIGAAINGACVFGTLTKIVSGDLSYLFVVLGLWLGALFVGITKLHVSPQISAPSTLGQFSWPTLVVWLCAVLVLLFGFMAFARRNRLAKAAIMSGIGLFGCLLYALHPYWNYSTLVRDLALDTIMAPMGMADSLLPWLVLAACSGGVVSTVLAGTFRVKGPTLRNSVGALLGGFLMAFGIVMIPGGNDGLVLFLLPSLVPAGLLAYIMMNGAIGLVLMIERQRAQDVQRGAS